jgi:predicted RNA-binding Zn-ribbon protein involved in translation (DUF1610 family)/uncharacterized protein YbaR (Trm112 family)
VVLTAPRHLEMEMSVPCPGCRTALPVNGPQRDLHCPDCTRDSRIDDKIWQHLDCADDTEANREYATGGLTYSGNRMIWRKADPACQACGASISLVSPPAWLKAMAPSLVQLYAAEREVEAAAGPLEGAAPIVFPCPQCGGALKVTGETSRVMRCVYCGVDAFLPDPLWLRLHPRKQIKPWFLRFEGTSAVDAERMEKASRTAREERAAREAERQEEARARAQAHAEAAVQARADAAAERSLTLTIFLGVVFTTIFIALVLIMV